MSPFSVQLAGKMHRELWISRCDKNLCNRTIFTLIFDSHERQRFVFALPFVSEQREKLARVGRWRNACKCGKRRENEIFNARCRRRMSALISFAWHFRLELMLKYFPISSLRMSFFGSWNEASKCFAFAFFIRLTFFFDGTGDRQSVVRLLLNAHIDWNSCLLFWLWRHYYKWWKRKNVSLVDRFASSFYSYFVKRPWISTISNVKNDIATTHKHGTMLCNVMLFSFENFHQFGCLLCRQNCVQFSVILAFLVACCFVPFFSRLFYSLLRFIVVISSFFFCVCDMFNEQATKKHHIIFHVKFSRVVNIRWCFVSALADALTQSTKWDIGLHCCHDLRHSQWNEKWQNQKSTDS